MTRFIWSLCALILVHQTIYSDRASDHTEAQTLINFSFNNKRLLDLIDELAQLKRTTIIFPQGNDAIKSEQTVTFHPAANEPLTIEAAWSLLIEYLHMAGYALIDDKPFYRIIKNDPKIASQVLPLYIVPAGDLPYSEQAIRYLYYFKNLKLSNEKVRSGIEAILKELLAVNSMFLLEPKTNSVIISGRADLIASAMHIITELDISGFKETIEIVPLYYAPVEHVKMIFDQLALAAGDTNQQPSLHDNKRPNSPSYFAEGTVVKADIRTNSLILMGKAQTIEKLQDFISEYLDTEPHTGKSILHIVDLQYLNSQEFAVILDQVMARKNPRDQTTNDSSINRAFGQVIIKAEPQINIQETVRDIQAGRVVDNALSLAQATYSGGNRLIIAAFEEEWLFIRDLIAKLDKPQKQVLLELFVADIRSNRDKIIASTVRNPITCVSTSPIPCGADNGVDFLASHISAASNVLPATATTLASDLLALDSNVAEPNAVELLAPGSLIVSFAQQCTGIWGLLQVLDTIADVNVISRPHLAVLNNEVGKVKVSVIRRALGAMYISNGTPVTPYEDIKADINIEIKPQINILNQVQLEVFIEISEFTRPLNAIDVTNETSDNQVNRVIRTNAQAANGKILALGGLSRNIETKTVFKTPILADIPIIGNLFKRERSIIQNLQLTVFIIPTVIEPGMRHISKEYTKDKLTETKEAGFENPFDNFKDPITRFFFSPENREGEIEVDEYIARGKKYEPSDVPFTDIPVPAVPAEKIKQLLEHEENPLLNIPVMRP